MKRTLSPEEDMVARMRSPAMDVREQAAYIVSDDPRPYADQLVKALEHDQAALCRLRRQVYCALGLCLVSFALTAFGFRDTSHQLLLYFVKGLQLLPAALTIYLICMRPRIVRRMDKMLRDLASVPDQRAAGVAVTLTSYGNGRSVARMLIGMLEAGTAEPDTLPFSSREVKDLYRCLRLREATLVAAVIRYLAVHGDESALKPLYKLVERTNERGGSDELRSLAREAIERIRARFTERGDRETLPRPASQNSALLHPATAAPSASELLTPAAGTPGGPMQTAPQATDLSNSDKMVNHG